MDSLKTRRRFGIRHPLPFLVNIGVVAKTLTVDAAAKADGLASSIFTPLAGLAGLFFPDADLPTPTSVSFKGFTLFYEKA